MNLLKGPGCGEIKETSGWRRRGGKDAAKVYLHEHEENTAHQERQVASKARRSGKEPSRAMIVSSRPSGWSAQPQSLLDMEEALAL